jgi:flavin reductase (DIM6/NTAB) family NADH-FMN oxidoreductase RutF
MSLSGTGTQEDVERVKNGFSSAKSDLKTFSLLQNLIQFECKVNDIIKLGTKKVRPFSNLIICEISKKSTY